MDIPHVVKYARTHLLDFLPPNSNSFLSLKSHIIKACEQTRVALELLAAAKGYVPLCLPIKVAECADKAYEEGNLRLINSVLTHYYLLAQGKCTYCKKRYAKKDMQMDTVYPTPFTHGHCKCRKENHQIANVSTGNAVLCCKDCNHKKGIFELRGRSLMRGIASKLFPSEMCNLEFQMQDKSKPPIDRFYGDFYADTIRYESKIVKNGRGFKYLVADHAVFRLVLPFFEMRVICVCEHHEKFFYLTFDEETNTLVAGCQKCTENKMPLLVFNVEKYQMNRRPRLYKK